MKENEQISIPELVSNGKGQFTGGFAELCTEEMSNTLGGDKNKNNLYCSDNDTCKGNGSCSGNEGKCKGNSVCIQLPNQDV